MMKSKRQKRLYEEHRPRSQSEDLHCYSDYEEDHCDDQIPDEEQLRCYEILDQDFSEISNLNFESNGSFYQCNCNKCPQFLQAGGSNTQDQQEKKRQKRRQYKKRQKLKAQQKKEDALRTIAQLIGDLYQLRTNCKKERTKINTCFQLIEKNENRFYQFINEIIRQQVEAIKSQMSMCLSQLASEPPNFSTIPRLYEQFVKVKEASPEIEFIINYFIKIIAEKNKETIDYHRDLDKKTFHYLLFDDVKNKKNFEKLKQLIKENNPRNCREKEMLRSIIKMYEEKRYIFEDEEEDQEEQEQDESQQYSEYSEKYDGSNQDHICAQNTTKSSQIEEDDSYLEEYMQDPEENKENRPRKGKSAKRRRKNKAIKNYQEVTFEKIEETLKNFEKSQSRKQVQKLPCNVDEEWRETFRKKYLKNQKGPSK